MVPSQVGNDPVGGGLALNVNLTGLWESRDYQCPWGVLHTELVEITHEGEKFVAIKVIGDECVPAGFESFTGRLPARASVGAISWTTGLPLSPASGRAAGFLKVVDENSFVAGSESGDLVFRRQTMAGASRDGTNSIAR